MFGKTKYIVIDGEFMEEMIVFNDTLQHCDVANALRVPVISGGFLFVKNGENYPEVECYGESISLGLKSRGEEDAVIARRLFNL